MENNFMNPEKKKKKFSDEIILDRNSEAFFVHEEDNLLNQKFINEKKFHGKQGHGYSAESSNDLADKILNKEIDFGVGNSNKKHGPDRCINGEYIQTKYYADYKNPLNKYFPNGKEIIYVDNSSGEAKPMKFEVPPEQYEKAKEYLQRKIDNGLYINGKRITVRAEDILVKGKIPYIVAKSISVGMNPLAWTYDALSGAILYKDDKVKKINKSLSVVGRGIPSFWEGIGMAACVTFFQNMIDGKGIKESLKRAICVGLKNGHIQINSYIFAGEMARRRVDKGFIQIKEKILSSVEKYGVKLIADSAAKKILSQVVGPVGTIISSSSLLIKFTRKDISKLIRGRISFSQAIKNVTKNLTNEAGHVGGKTVGSIVGAAISGGALIKVGGMVGEVVGHSTGRVINIILDRLLIDDADKMLSIIEDEYYNISSVYLFTEKEHDFGVSECVKKIDNKFLEKMFASKDRSEFANRMIKPIIDTILFKRRINHTVSDNDIVSAFDNLMDEAIEGIYKEENDYGFFTELRISYKNEFGENCCPHCGAVLSGYGYSKCFYCLNTVDISEY